MICCKECLDLLHDYKEGTLEPSVKSSLEEHFSDCPPCISFLKTYETTTEMCRETLKATEIPEQVQLKLKEFVEENIKKS